MTPTGSWLRRSLRRLFAIFGLLVLPAVLPHYAGAASFPCTTASLIISAQNGMAGNPGTWMGGTVPTDGNCVVIRHHVTLNSDWGTEGGTGLGWIRIENSGVLDSDCASPHSIYFGSTGTNPIGSGTGTNPGADASMFGFFVSYGTLNLSCAQPNNLTITSADESNPWYIHHVGGDYIGCNAIVGNVCNGSSGVHGAVLNLRHVAASHLGTNVTYFYGIDWDMTAGKTPANSLAVSSSHVSDLYEIVAEGGSLQVGNWMVTSNWFDAPRPNPVQGLIYFDAGGPTNWIVTDNTVTGAVTASFILGAPHNVTGLQLLRNAVLGSSTVQFAIASILGGAPGSGNLLAYNLCVNPEPPESTTNPCVSIGGADGDTTTSVSYNVIQGGHAGISQVDNTTFSPAFRYNWISQWKEDYPAQGAIITRTGTVTETYNVLVIENSAPLENMIGNLAYSGGGTCNATVQQDHNTIYGVANLSGNPTVNFNWGDNGTSPHTCVINNYVRSNISYGANVGFSNYNNDNTWNLSAGIEFGGAAVHHNLAYNATIANYQNTQTTPGFDNGIIHHPSQAQYGDLTVDPQFVNPTRRPAGYDAVCGGPGTDTDLFLNLAMRSGFGGIYNSCYSTALLWNWIRQGWAPLNKQLMHAAHDGTYIGAVPPIGVNPP